MRPFGVRTRESISSHASTANTTALLLVSNASKSASAASAGSPVKPARASDFGWRCAAIWQRAQTPAASANPVGIRSPIAR